MREIEIFSAGCRLCNDVVAQVTELACPSCNITVRDMNEGNVSERAKDLGVQSVPAVAIDGALVECCAGRGVNLDALKAAGLGQPG